jgi:hypothetical protein
VVWVWSRLKAAGSEIAMRNHTFSDVAAAYRCSPYLTASPVSSVTTNAASTTPPAAPPMPNASAVSAAPITANPAINGTRSPYSPPGSFSPTYSAPYDRLSQYVC